MHRLLFLAGSNFKHRQKTRCIHLPVVALHVQDKRTFATSYLEPPILSIEENGLWETFCCIMHRSRYLLW